MTTRAHIQSDRTRLARGAFSLFSLFAVAALAAACGNQKAPAPAAKAAPVAAAPVVAAAAPGAGATEADCTSLAGHICTSAGPTSAACTSMQTAAKLLTPAACKVALGDLEYSTKQLTNLNKSCDELVKKLCADLGPTTPTCKMVTEKTPSFGGDRCTKMLGEYAKVLGQLKQMEDANKPLGADKIAAIAAPGGSEFGPKDAKVTIVEFSDFQCPYCTRAADATKQLKKKYGDKVRFIFRQFPLGFHKNAHLAAQASLAANAQGKFWEYHDTLFANQKALLRPDLEKYAKTLGLDMVKFKKALDEGTYKAAVDADMKLGQSVGVQGTPTLMINGEKGANAADADAIGKRIDELLAATK